MINFFDQFHFKSLLKRTYRIFKNALVSFIKHECYNKSASLAFYTLLSIVPVLAVTIGIAKGFGLQESLENFILDKFKENKEIAVQVLEFASKTLHHAEGSLITGFGVLVLFWSVFSLLGSIEASLNDIWHVKSARTWGRKITHNITLILLCPLLLAIGSSATVFLIAQIRLASELAIGETVVNPFMHIVVNLFSLVMSWVLFACIYVFLPNTQVKFRYGLGAGIVAGTFYQIVQAVYIHIQIFLTSYGAVYGSLAAIPLFFIWLQVSWLIVLMGAELAFMFESDLIQFPFGSDKSEPVSKNTVALLITKKCMEALIEGRSPLSLSIIARQLGISLETAMELTSNLVDGGILIEARSDTCYQGFQPGLPLKEISFQKVLIAINEKAKEKVQIRPSSYVDEMSEAMQGLELKEISESTPLLTIHY